MSNREQNTELVASGTIKNYNHESQVIHTVGRSENNLDLIDDPDGFIDSSSNASYLYNTTLTQYTKPQRKRYEGVIANKFSAPGSWETALTDIESGEYSPYNALPFRNLTVRTPLNNLLKYYMSGSGYNGVLGENTASFHKINKNTQYKVVPNSYSLMYPSQSWHGSKFAALDSSANVTTWSYDSDWTGSDGEAYVSNILASVQTKLNNNTDLEIYIELLNPDSASGHFYYIYGASDDFDEVSCTYHFSDYLNWPYGLFAYFPGETFWPKQASWGDGGDYTIATWLPDSFETQSVYDNGFIQYIIPATTSSYYYETESNGVSLTGTQKQGILESFLTSSYVVSGTTALQQKRIYRKNNQLSIIQGGVIDERGRGVRAKDQEIVQEPPVDIQPVPIKAKVLIDDKILQFNSSYEQDKFANEKLNTAWTDGEKKFNKSLINTLEQSEYDSTIYHSRRIFPRSQNLGLKDTTRRNSFQFYSWPSSNGRYRKVEDFYNRSNALVKSGSVWPLDYYYDTASVAYPGELLDIRSSNNSDAQYALYRSPGTTTGLSTLSARETAWIVDQSSSVPYFDVEEDYLQNISNIYAFSLVSEYNISNKLEQDYTQLISSTIDSNLYLTGTSNKNINYYIMSDGLNVANPIKKFLLKIEGIKKFKSYNDLYPCNFTLKIAEVFSGSLIADTNTFPAITRPFFAPGILFNSIKASLPLHYPVKTGSAGSLGNEELTIFPFESIRNPYAYLENISIFDCEYTSSMDFYSGSYSEEYSNIINNFLDETVEFFIENSKQELEYWKSASETSFNTFISGVSYGMDIVIENKANLNELLYTYYLNNSLYSDWESYGPTYSVTTVGGSWDTTKIYSPYTPPYILFNSTDPIDLGGGMWTDYYQWVNSYNTTRIIFTPEETRQYSIDEIFSGSTIESILTNDEWGTGFSETPSPLKSSVQNPSSSFNLFNKKVEKINGVEQIYWSINGKWECPALNFTRVKQIGSNSTYGNKLAGLWHQYGEINQQDEGLFLIIKDLTNTASLAQHVKFFESEEDRQTLFSSKRIGGLKENQVLEELVVAIPIIDGQSVIDTNANDYDEINNRNEAFMKKYMFPPQYDFYNNRSVDPFFAMCFEFKSAISKEDLSRIWQNVMPSLSFSHELESLSLEVDHPKILAEIQKPNTRWMFFKCKKRAKTNQQRGKYGYNWPYDYFSLVELIKAEVEVEYE